MYNNINTWKNNYTIIPCEIYVKWFITLFHLLGSMFKVSRQPNLTGIYCAMLLARDYSDHTFSGVNSARLYFKRC